MRAIGNKLARCDRQDYRYADAAVRQDGIGLGARASLRDATGVDSTEKIG